MREVHRARRAGLTGPARETGWAVLVDGDAAGSVRLKLTDEAGVVETGVWLTRSSRGRGVGRLATAEVLVRARELGATAVVADTAAGNAGARGILGALGFTCAEPDAAGRVHARLDLRP